MWMIAACSALARGEPLPLAPVVRLASWRGVEPRSPC
jgi:hypothetical protein